MARVTKVHEAAVFPSASEVTHWDGGVSLTDGAKDGCADAEQDDAETIAARADASRETSDSRSTRTDSPLRSSCSGPGNARSSCWSETSTTRARGTPDDQFAASVLHRSGTRLVSRLIAMGTTMAAINTVTYGSAGDRRLTCVSHCVARPYARAANVTTAGPSPGAG